MRRPLLLFCLFPLLAIAQQPRLVLPIGHLSSVESAYFSPDGKKIVTAGWDFTAKIWDSETGALLADLRGHKNSVTSAHFSPDGKKVITVSNDFTAKIWDTETGVLLADLKGHTNKVSSADFSSNGKKVLTSSYDHTAKIWNSETGALLADLKGHTNWLQNAQFSPDGKKIVTASWDHTARIWNSETGELIAVLYKHTKWVTTALFSPDGKKIATASGDETTKLWNSETGELLAELKGHTLLVNDAYFSPDGKKIVTTSIDNTAIIWNSESGELMAVLKGHKHSVISARFSPDGKRIITNSEDKTAKIWNSETGVMLADLKGHRSWVNTADFSPNGKKVVTASSDNTTKIWDSETGIMLSDIKGHTEWVVLNRFSPGGNKIITSSEDHTAKIWNSETGVLLANLKGHLDIIESAHFSPDGKKIVTASWDHTARIWNSETGKWLAELAGHSHSVKYAHFSPDGKKIVTASSDSTAKIWNSETGQLLADLKGHRHWVHFADFSPDGKRIVTTSWDNTARIWNSETGQMLSDLKGHTNVVTYAHFSPDGKKIVTASFDSTARIWDSESGILLATLKGNGERINYAHFSPDGKKIATASWDQQLKIWNSETGNLERTSGLPSNYIVGDIDFSNLKIIARYQSEVALLDYHTGKKLRTFIAIDSIDYLTYDAYGRYDGTEAARKMLYFTCGDEVISLEQVKDQLWIPGLSQKLMKGESIDVPKLSELEICGLTPVVENKEQAGSYQFVIIPRKGGLGETVLFINGIELKRYKPAELVKKGSSYILEIRRDRLQQYFVTGQENTVMVKAFTAKNDISSRGFSLKASSNLRDTLPPNLYAVMVGVSDYKGEELDLKYAAKDAQDICNAMEVSARKLLNRDGKEHVFMYRITTAENSPKYPWKQSIQQVFEEIGRKATPKDILLIFFAGHGTTGGDKNQFYFLTADASKNSELASSGISMAELNDWIKPTQIKAQKRVLIFDACNSGQAINDLVTIGNRDDQYVAARNDDESRRIKSIEKLNERSGMLILSAAASNQAAYEIGKYSQGLLTYCLLKAIKDDPAILEEGKLLSVDKWFWTAEKNVSEIVSQASNRQHPQKFGTGGFYIGEVDQEVIAAIVLPREKPLFTAATFMEPLIGDDNLELSKEVNRQLNELSSRGPESRIYYSIASHSSDAYALTGTYEITGEDLRVKVNIKQGREILHRFEFTGKAGDLAVVVEHIVKTATEWVETIPKR